MERAMWEEVIESVEFKESLIYAIEYAIGTVDPDNFEGEDEDDVAYNDLTVGMNEDGGWSFQTGDNSFTGGAYGFPHWAVVSITGESDPDDVFKEIVDQLADLMSQ